MEQPQVTKQETEELLRLAKSTLNNSVEGDFVELGCYRGDTSVLLQRLLKGSGKLSEKKLWIYDSFAGLPEKTSEDSSVAGDQFKAGELFVSKREVLEKFKRSGLPLPIVKKAFFEKLDPEKDLPEKIAFAFLDGDLYGSIKTSFELVLPKLSEKGIIVVHDYNNPELPGVSKAVEEFLNQNPDFSLSQKYSLALLSK
ncbi:class I SAM-dependent methyltransferase [Candidatus Saccharibacteria bacterium]|nr:class I SAM-dependent methyltransferase [Candidatus Saccharibacteria bacterium]